MVGLPCEVQRVFIGSMSSIMSVKYTQKYSQLKYPSYISEGFSTI